MPYELTNPKMVELFVKPSFVYPAKGNFLSQKTFSSILSLVEPMLNIIL